MIRPLEEDLSLLGFQPIWETETPETYDRLVAIVDATSELGRSTCTDTSTGEFDARLQTAFGRATSLLLSKNVTFCPAGLRCCRNTEGFLRQALFSGHDAEYDYYRRGPLALIIDQDEVIAVQKNLGDPSVYPLVERPEWGLHVGTIAAPSMRIRPSRIEDIADTVLVPAYMYEYFHPKRLAMTMVDMPYRKILAEQSYDMHAFNRKGLLLTHENIIKRISRLRLDAVNFDPSFMLKPAVATSSR